MTLQEVLGHLRAAAATFAGGSQIVGTEQARQAFMSLLALDELVEMAKRNSKQRIDPLIEESAILRKLATEDGGKPVSGSSPR